MYKRIFFITLALLVTTQFASAAVKTKLSQTCTGDADDMIKQIHTSKNITSLDGHSLDNIQVPDLRDDGYCEAAGSYSGHFVCTVIWQEGYWLGTLHCLLG